VDTFPFRRQLSVGAAEWRHGRLQRRAQRLVVSMSFPVVNLVGRAENHLLSIFAAEAHVSAQTVGIEKAFVTL